jgi:hypothetical protein
MHSCGALCSKTRVGLLGCNAVGTVDTNVSVVHAASIFRAEGVLRTEEDVKLSTKQANYSLFLLFSFEEVM